LETVSILEEPAQMTNPINTMKITLRKSADRGHANHGWLKSHHSFSFADYYDPAHMNFRSLRVINEDFVAPAGGFPTHPHRDMEIFTYMVKGALEHKDSMGNGKTLRPGQIQVMSAGSGVTHSEFNPSRTDAAHLLQIWIMPDRRNLTPRYTEWEPQAAQENAPKVLMISQDGREGSATISQNASIYQVRPDAENSVPHHLESGRGLWVQVVSGRLKLNGVELLAGDAASAEEAGDYLLESDGPAEAMLFDLK
jgi:redox-sensitive bicupin YhaK (pirin superfamily)